MNERAPMHIRVDTFEDGVPQAADEQARITGAHPFQSVTDEHGLGGYAASNFDSCLRPRAWSLQMAEKQPDRRQIGLERECHRYSADRADPFRGPSGRRSAISIDGDAGLKFGCSRSAPGSGDEALRAPLPNDRSKVCSCARPWDAPRPFELRLQILHRPAGLDQLPREARRVIVSEEAIGTDVEKQQAAVDRKLAYPH